LAAHLQGALPAISLASHTALATAFANDVAADMVFAQQVYGYGKPGDVLIGISTSGNSGNVVRALQVARALGLRTIGLTGRGGRMHPLCNVSIRVPFDSTPKVQERHLPIYHALCMMLEEVFFPS
jgi:D-sedoheptulose 7-phosphate isomerase